MKRGRRKEGERRQRKEKAGKKGDCPHTHF